MGQAHALMKKDDDKEEREGVDVAQLLRTRMLSTYLYLFTFRPTHAELKISGLFHVPF